MDKRKYKMIYKEDKKRCKDKMRFWAAFLFNIPFSILYNYRIAKLIVILFLFTVIRV